MSAGSKSVSGYAGAAIGGALWGAAGGVLGYGTGQLVSKVASWVGSKIGPVVASWFPPATKTAGGSGPVSNLVGKAFDGVRNLFNRSRNAGYESGGTTGSAQPGSWVSKAEGMSDASAAYQSQITGRAAGSVYRVNGVDFDGYVNGVLQEAKGNYSQFVNNGEFLPWFSGADKLLSQARSQLAAANGTPIEWSVAQPEAVRAIQSLFARNGILGINVKYVPAQ